LLPLVGRDFFVAAIEYRFSQDAVFPAQIEDCKCAIRYLRAHAARYGIDPDRIGAWGSSAGGHLVSLLGTSGDAEELEGAGGWPEYSSRVQAVVDWYGPTDLLQMGGTHDDPDSPESRLVGGTLQDHKEAAARANPITYLSQDCPPFLIMHGTEDRTVPPNQSELLHAAMQAKGLQSELVMVPGKGHEPLGEEATQRVYDFFSRHLSA
jgi:acetyl esterase/lipase